jgi:undecaprenyl diphosphate synthase
MTNGRRPDARSGLHAAIVMDGNGRWATGRRQPRLAGHRAGADTVRRLVVAAPDPGLRMLPRDAFSYDNWSRPAAEVRGLMHLLGEYLKLETPNCVKDGVRLSFIGRRDRSPARLAAGIEEAERLTEACGTLDLRIALDYSSRDVIARAARSMNGDGGDSRDALAARIAEAMHSRDGTPEVDLLIRTGGEQRLSDFMMWEAAYAELFFTGTMWPDFQAEELGRIVVAFHGRERRFGGLPQRAAS